MRWRRDRPERPPRVGAAMLAKALVGVLVIFVCSGAGVAAAGYFQFEKIIDPPTPVGAAPPPPPIPDIDPEPPEPGGPRTLLVLGSDRRSAHSIDSKLGQEPHSDTIVLIRLDPKRKRIAVLSLPRDLAVTVPGVGDGVKINQAYDEGGPKKTLETVKHLFESSTGEHFPVNSVIDVNFKGFQRAVNYVGGVYVDVDRRYHNPEGTGFAAIDVNAGYQKLKGKDALAYVRYRHADSDIFRNARQQDFLREAASQPAVRRLKDIRQAAHLVQVFRGYFRFDKRFMTRKNLAGLLKTGLFLALGHAPVVQLKLPGITESDDPENDTRLFVSPENIKKAYDAFMTGEGARPPVPKRTPARAKHRVTGARVSGLENARRAGEDLAVPAARKLRFPFYFPEWRARGSQYVTGTPRVYRIRDLRHKRHQAYRLVIAAGAPGEYYGVQGMTWRSPPILANPDRIRIQNGRRLLEFFDGRHLRMIGWRTPHGAYWVTNTLSRSISNARMLAIAASLRRLGQR